MMTSSQSNPAPIVTANQIASTAFSSGVSGRYGGKSLSPKLSTPYSSHRIAKLRNDSKTAPKTDNPSLFGCDQLWTNGAILHCFNSKSCANNDCCRNLKASFLHDFILLPGKGPVEYVF